MLAIMGSFKGTPYLILDCEEGVRGTTVWEPGNTFSEIYVTIHPTLIIMSATFDYFIHFSIPYRLNRILKTNAEIEKEEKEKLELLEKKNKVKTRCCLCCKYEVKGKKKKTKSSRSKT